jgi:hypothetical protein
MNFKPHMCTASFCYVFAGTLVGAINYKMTGKDVKTGYQEKCENHDDDDDYGYDYDENPNYRLIIFRKSLLFTPLSEKLQENSTH